MNTLSAQPSLNQLSGFISTVRSYPISAGQVLKLARKTGAPSEIVGFYESFDPQRTFDSQEDLAVSSEQVDLMRQESSEMPREEEKAPEDY